jgi:signal transduction histidine kinase
LGDQAAGFAHPSSGDEGARPAEQLADVARVAEAVRDVVSARATMVSRVVDEEWLEVLVVAGTPSRDDLVGHRWRLAEFEALLAAAEQRGRVHLTTRRVVTYVEVPEDAWHLPRLLGLLLAPLRNTRGELVGVLATEGPVDIVDPAPGVCERVELYADQARLALESLHEHGVLAERLRLTDAGQSVLDDAVRAEDVSAMLDAVAVGLAGMMRAAATWACAEVSPGVHAEAASYPEAVADRLGPEVCTLLDPLVEECRRESRVMTHQSSPLLGRLAGVTGHDQALLVAVGEGDEPRGALLLLRGADDPPWSAAERQAARAVARRVGTVVTRLEGRRRDQQVVDELRELDQYRRDLVASLTHDLKTPLTAISLNTELLESDRRLEKAGSHPVAAIRRSADRLASLVDDLLALARTEEGGLSRTEVGDVSEILRGACRHAEGEAQLRGITFSVDMPEQLTAKVDADALARVYANVVGNAVKFSLPDGEVRLSLRRHGDVVELVCSDDGIGITPEDQAAVFDMFRRSDDPLVRIVPGTGVGLAISHRIVTRLGGDIGVESTPGEGSTFTVRVPG